MNGRFESWNTVDHLGNTFTYHCVIQNGKRYEALVLINGMPLNG